MDADNTGLWKALLGAQGEIEHASKDARNPHLKNKYATLGSVLDTIKPVLTKHGLVLTQYIMGVNQQMFPGSTAVVTKITHADTGISTEDNQIIPLPKNDPQGLGSAITYARRYGIKSMLGMSEEDDDGNAGSVNNTRTTTAAPVLGGNTTSEMKTSDAPADPKKVEEMTQKLSASLGFKKVT